MTGPATAQRRALDAAVEHLARTQDASGSWRGDYGGPLFLLPMFVVTARIAGYPLDGAARDGMARFLRGHQNGDGGFGLHVEGGSHVFTTALAYVALRALGAEPSDPALALARSFLSAHGGPLASASWGKFVLAVAGLYDWDGVRPVPPEPWLLPEALPVHPSRMWCHARMVYLPMAYLYARRASAPHDAFVAALREELYDGAPWDRIPWRASRDTVAATDRYVPLGPAAVAAQRLLGAFERVAPAGLRARALGRVLELVRAEDEATDFICLGPVNKLLNTLVWHFEKPGGRELARHFERMSDYLWRGERGVNMQGYNSSQLWDTAFAVQALVAAGAGETHGATLRAAHGYLRDNQVTADVPDRERAYRDASRGGWPFSTRAHGWPISDCTAEAVRASLLLEPLVDDPLPVERLDPAVALILSMQNADGGWATYERTRGPRWLERLNPSDCFADIMIDRSYVECTSACVQALAAFALRHPGRDRPELRRAIRRGGDFLLEAQRADGSWEGSWGICFTYGTWFGTAGLRACGIPPEHPALRRAAQFLESVQRPDGGWGETPDSCRTSVYAQAEDGQAVMTSWALLALAATGDIDAPAARAGVRFLERRQREDGSFPPEHIAGVFNKTCAIHYDNYLKFFPVWALAVAARPGPEHPEGGTP